MTDETPAFQQGVTLSDQGKNNVNDHPSHTQEYADQNRGYEANEAAKKESQS